MLYLCNARWCLCNTPFSCLSHRSFTGKRNKTRYLVGTRQSAKGQQAEASQVHQEHKHIITLCNFSAADFCFCFQEGQKNVVRWEFKKLNCHLSSVVRVQAIWSITSANVLDLIRPLIFRDLLNIKCWQLVIVIDCQCPSISVQAWECQERLPSTVSLGASKKCI